MKENIKIKFGMLFVLFALILLCSYPVSAAEVQVRLNEDCIFTLTKGAEALDITYANPTDQHDHRITVTCLEATSADLEGSFWINRNGVSIGYGGKISKTSPVWTEIVDLRHKEFMNEPGVIVKGSEFVFSLYSNNGSGGLQPGSSMKIRIRMEPVTSITNADVKLDKTGFIYNGKEHTPKVSVTLEGKSLKEGVDYEVSYNDCTNAGYGYVKVTGIGAYHSSTFSDDFRIDKASNPLKVKARSVSLKYSKLRKKAQSVTCSKLMKISGAQGKLSYKLAGVNKSRYKSYFKINSKNGKLTIKKGLPKDSYKVKIKVTAAGNGNYKKASKTVSVKIKIK